MLVILKVWIISQFQRGKEDNQIYAACDVFEPPTDKDNKEEQAL